MAKIGRRVGVLLAGGASKRMHQDKLTLLFEGKTLCERGCHALQTLAEHKVLDDYVVSGNIRRADTTIIVDKFPDQGPAGGILSTIKTLDLKENDLVIALPVDMPLLDNKHLCRLIEASCLHTRSFCYHNAWLPISIVITNELLRAIDQQGPDQKGLSVKQIFMLSHGKSLQPEIAEQLTNVNTPEQWQRILSRDPCHSDT